MLGNLPAERPEFGRPMVVGFLKDPRFNDVLRVAAGRKAKLFGDDKPLHRFAVDRSSSLLGIFALALHFTDAGLTVGGLQALRAQSNCCSVGRAAAFIAAMRKRGDFIPADAGARQRVRKLVLSDRFHAFQRERIRIDIESLAALSPIGRLGLEAFDQPRFIADYMHVVAEGLAPVATLTVPAVDFFSERNAGLLMLHDIVASSADSLLSKPVAVSISQLSKRYETSRTHILRLLRDADKAGLLVWEAEARQVTLTPPLVRALQGYNAHIFAGAAYCTWMITAGKALQQ
jgi:hypothetical protein